MIAINNASASLPDLTDIDNSSVTVNGGSSLSLSGVDTYNNSTLGVTTFAAGDTGSALTFANLAGIDAGTGVDIEGASGGTVSLPALKASTGGNVEFQTQGSNASVNLPLLASLTGSGNQISASQSAISAPLLTTFTSGNLFEADQALSFPLLADIDGTSIFVVEDGQLTLPAVTSVNVVAGISTSWNV